MNDICGWRAREVSQHYVHLCKTFLTLIWQFDLEMPLSFIHILVFKILFYRHNTSENSFIILKFNLSITFGTFSIVSSLFDNLNWFFQCNSQLPPKHIGRPLKLLILCWYVSIKNVCNNAVLKQWNRNT